MVNVQLNTFLKTHKIKSCNKNAEGRLGAIKFHAWKLQCHSLTHVLNFYEGQFVVSKRLVRFSFCMNRKICC